MSKPTSRPPLVQCVELCKTFDHQLVLDHINLTVPRGKIIGLLGRNGAGKSTLIKSFNGLVTPDSGKIRIDGQPVGIHSKTIISYLPERTYLDKSMCINEALHYFTEFYADFDLTKAKRLVKELGLDPEQKIAKMSKGMQEKLQLILVMSRQAELYILDEPLGGVDPVTRDYILDTILSNFNPGASLIISTHLIADIERILDEVIFIDHGRIILTSDADQLRRKYHTSIDEIFRQQFTTNHKGAQHAE